jgi:hypothetical protein
VIGKRSAGVLLVTLAIAAAAGVQLASLSTRQLPAEDAAMLLRYSANLAHGHGIVWNPGDAPVDGATDFLFMLGVAALVRIGLPVVAAAKVLGGAAHLTLLIIVGFFAARLRGVWRYVGLASVLYLAVGPGKNYVAYAFGTPLFALAVAVAWVAARNAALTDSTSAWILFSITATSLGMFRPEGALVALFIAGALAIDVGPGRRGPLWRMVAPVFVSVGGAYFLWHWRYFGFPLPNPFYRKGGGTLYWSSLSASTRNVVRLARPFLLLFPLGVLTRTRRFAASALLVVGGFTAMWLLLSNEMNIAMRFQYPIVGIIVLASLEMASRSTEGIALDRRLRPAAALIAVTIGAGSIVGLASEFAVPDTASSAADVAQILQDHPTAGRRIATTEAGLLPLISGWRCLDVWGLNDSWIAHHGTVTAEVLDRFDPDVVMFHANFSPAVPRPGPPYSPWDGMTIVLDDYVRARGFELAAAFGSGPFEAHYYYVNGRLPERPVLVDAIRRLRYRWPETGAIAVDFAALSPANQR